MTDVAASQSQPLFKKRAAKQTTRKRPATPPPESSDSDSGYTSSENESGQRIKRRKKSALVTASSKISAAPPDASVLTTTTYTADRSTALTSTNDATKASNWFDEADSSQLLGSSKNKPPLNPSSSSAATALSTEKPKAVGPTKAPTNVRTITVTDFAPDVCKDYKQTGFCGYGDSCKFLHARENYKQGWQLDRDWEIGGGGKNKSKGDGGEELDEEEKMLKDIPFKCVICKDDYKRPIVTKCGHYFCEGCALGRYKRQPSCAICGAGTGGVFNGAKQLAKLLEKKKEREKEARDKKRKEGEEVDSPDEDGGN